MSACSSSGMSSLTAVDVDVDVAGATDVDVEVDGTTDADVDDDGDAEDDVYAFPLLVPVVRLIIIKSPSSHPCSVTSVASCNHLPQVDEPHK